MKKIILTAFLLSFICSTGLAWWPFVAKKETKQPVPTNVVQKKPTLSEGREIVKELAAELKVAKQQNLNLKTSLDKANLQLKQAEAKTVEVQKAADELKEWGIIQQAEAQKFMEKYNNAVKRYHRLKAIAAIIAAVAGLFIGVQLINLVPPPYNIAVPFGGAGLFAALVWIFL